MMLDMADPSDGQVLKADLCIIGAGAAGISIALQFIGQGFDVLLVESGGRRHEPEIQDMYAGSVERPDVHASPDRFRCRQFGGSTTLWGGRCVPFDPIDFETRSYIPHSGWPITYSELTPFIATQTRSVRPAHSATGLIGVRSPDAPDDRGLLQRELLD